MAQPEIIHHHKHRKKSVKMKNRKYDTKSMIGRKNRIEK
jgi:hypothetical protein